MAENRRYTEDLPNKPLGEAIFELKWALPRPNTQGLQHDPGFRILFGRFYDHIKEDYPYIEDLPIAQVPEDMTPHVVRHRFRPSEDAWPLIQLGPGIITVNETEGYTWREFKSRVQASVGALFKSYPTDLNQLTLIGAQLTYINAVLFDPSEQSTIDFLRDNLHVSINVEPDLFDNPEAARHPLELNLNMSFSLDRPRSTGTIRFSHGRKNQQPALVWQIVIHSTDNQVQQGEDNLSLWLKEAHDVAEDWFFKLSRGKLLESFEGKHENSQP